VLDPFAVGKTSLVSSSSGTIGLGLYFCRLTIEEMERLDRLIAAACNSGVVTSDPKPET
jgi:hypothetical protein